MRIPDRCSGHPSCSDTVHNGFIDPSCSELSPHRRQALPYTARDAARCIADTRISGTRIRRFVRLQTALHYCHAQKDRVARARQEPRERLQKTKISPSHSRVVLVYAYGAPRAIAQLACMSADSQALKSSGSKSASCWKKPSVRRQEQSYLVYGYGTATPRSTELQQHRTADLIIADNASARHSFCAVARFPSSPIQRLKILLSRMPRDTCSHIRFIRADAKRSSIQRKFH